MKQSYHRPICLWANRLSGMMPLVRLPWILGGIGGGTGLPWRLVSAVPLALGRGQGM